MSVDLAGRVCDIWATEQKRRNGENPNAERVGMGLRADREMPAAEKQRDDLLIPGKEGGTVPSVFIVRKEFPFNSFPPLLSPGQTQSLWTSHEWPPAVYVLCLLISLSIMS
jgi:hypothetical protein